MEKYRVTICKANGSVWMEEYDGIHSVLEIIKELLHKHPHILISRQRVIRDDKES